MTVCVTYCPECLVSSSPIFPACSFWTVNNPLWVTADSWGPGAEKRTDFNCLQACLSRLAGGSALLQSKTKKYASEAPVAVFRIQSRPLALRDKLERIRSFKWSFEFLPVDTFPSTTGRGLYYTRLDQGWSSVQMNAAAEVLPALHCCDLSWLNVLDGNTRPHQVSLSTVAAAPAVESCAEVELLLPAFWTLLLTASGSAMAIETKGKVLFS